MDKLRFSFEFGLRMHCDSKGARIRAFVGSKDECFATALMRESFNNSKSDGLFELTHIKYDENITEEEITNWSKRIVREVMENVKKLAQ